MFKKLVGIVGGLILVIGLIAPTVCADEGTVVSINTPESVVVGENFTATIDITNLTDPSNSVQYDVSFNPTVIQLNNVTDGVMGIAGTSEITPDTLRIVQSLGLKTTTNSGYLAILHFQVVGSPDDSSDIVLSNGVLSGIEGEISTSWLGANVTVTSIPGDANGDGDINVLDITKLARIILLLDPETSGADANQDGVVNVLDMTKVARIILFLDPWPVG